LRPGLLGVLRKIAFGKLFGGKDADFQVWKAQLANLNATLHKLSE